MVSVIAAMKKRAAHLLIVCSVLAVIMILPLSYFSFLVEAQQYPDFFAGREPAGRPLEKLAQEYWQWWIGVPWDNIPINPETNLNECLIAYDETGLVAFLVNPYGISYNSICNISSDKHLIVPLLVGECDPTVPEPATKSGKIEDLWECATSADEPFENWEVVLDNKVLFKQSGNDKVNSNLKKDILVRNSSQFILDIPEVNSYEAPGGSYPAVVDGYYLTLKPLPPGEHVLQYNILHKPAVPGQLEKPVSGSVTYRLNVTE